MCIDDVTCTNTIRKHLEPATEGAVMGKRPCCGWCNNTKLLNAPAGATLRISGNQTPLCVPWSLTAMMLILSLQTFSFFCNAHCYARNGAGLTECAVQRVFCHVRDTLNKIVSLHRAISSPQCLDRTGFCRIHCSPSRHHRFLRYSA